MIKEKLNKMMKDLEKHKKKFKPHQNNSYLLIQGIAKEHFILGYKEALEDVLRVIDADLIYQETQLTGDYDKDKAIKWRIIGERNLRDEIEVIE